ncbi:MAG: sulfite exporter TauE/SafE family protein [Sphingobium sp.]|nr:sulfite exporter TauE/SafE family protein [Sphingobium sp.]MBP6113089.1 sulfite exporter TauE/SafE family protein [Sphingobium sp.]MBP8669952.1 sulfite exporter TauE/SafE family protein [Sphingobium sp.]MBP9158336.1 sulfite exporter TauE/SafE family protein [Sphingobium sp.]MCC6480976.1 sulfite exporter TauE/SafE family protein [Sphingomonadaceae bacterium]
MSIASVSMDEVLLMMAALAAAGVITGLLAGIFGVGGGAVIVPVLYEIFRLMGVSEDVRMQMCVGTSLAIIVPTSISSFRAHLRRKAVEMPVLRLWLIPVILGVVLGGYTASFAPAWLFKAVFVAVASISAFKLLCGRDSWRFADSLPGKAAMRLYGFVIGLASALMGIGGGALSNLVFSLYNVPIHRAVATSAGLGVIISIPGVLAYILSGWSKMAQLPPYSIGYVSLIGFAMMMPASIYSAPWGARIAHALPKRKLEVAFGVYLALVAIRFILTLLS